LRRSFEEAAEGTRRFTVFRQLPSFLRVISLCAVFSALVLAPLAPLFAASNIAALAPAEIPLLNVQQAKLLQEQFSALSPQRSGVTDVYAIGIAGWAQQDVFLKEMDGALKSIGKALPVNGGTLRLVNRPDTAARIPLASRQNFAAAVHAVGSIMDKDEDILILFLTSHGSRGGVALQLPGIMVALSPAEVAAVLKKEGIKNRVVIVSACYSGVFAKPLANTNTIVLTAADDKNTSFGCAPGREWTYFGDALFNQSLRPGTDFQRAFKQAKTLIQGWETKEKLHPSNPQARFGKALTEKLAPLFDAAAHVGQ
jgi:hypothetical protein